MWEGVAQCGKVYHCICDTYVCVCDVWMSLSHVLMMVTQEHLCVHLIAGWFGHVAKAYMAKTF